MTGIVLEAGGMDVDIYERSSMIGALVSQGLKIPRHFSKFFSTP